MDHPNPDPGEEYSHINTQLFGPSTRGNRFVPAEAMVAPYNAPERPVQRRRWTASSTDYISAFTAEIGRQPTYEEYAQIMTGYTPEQMPVISGIAGFATFDHWFCEVPSQTFTNRSFFHGGDLVGLRDQQPGLSNFTPQDGRDVERLEAHGARGRSMSTNRCGCPSRA